MDEFTQELDEAMRVFRTQVNFARINKAVRPEAASMTAEVVTLRGEQARKFKEDPHRTLTMMFSPNKNGN